MSEVTKKNVCNICAKEFSRKDALQRHIESVHNKKKFKCPICEQEISRKDLLDRHIKKFHNREPSDVYKQARQEAKQEPKVEPKVEPFTKTILA